LPGERSRTMSATASSVSKVKRRRETLVSYLFLLPSLAIFAGFVIAPWSWDLSQASRIPTGRQPVRGF
jgi:hypothetical protein